MPRALFSETVTSLVTLTSSSDAPWFESSSLVSAKGLGSRGALVLGDWSVRLES